MSQSDAAEDPFEETRMTLGEHLEELRTRLFRSTVVLAVVFVGAWIFRAELADLFFQPYRKATAQLEVSLVEKLQELVEAGEVPREKAFVDEGMSELTPEYQPKDRPKGDSASAGFFFYMKICGYFALFVGGPYLIFQLWQFVAAGLYRHERKTVMRFFPFSAALFVTGVVFGFLLMVPYALFFLADISILQIEYYETIDNYTSFLLSLTLALGLVFQLPMLMIALSSVGVVEPSLYSRYRPHFVVGALIFAAVLTPPDPFTQMMMGVPMVVLYEVGAIVARMTWRQRSHPASGEEPS